MTFLENINISKNVIIFLHKMCYCGLKERLFMLTKRTIINDLMINKIFTSKNHLLSIICLINKDVKGYTLR